MLWDSALIARLLNLYKDNRVLWDQKHPHYSDKSTKQMALQGIQEELMIPATPNDIHRKYRTMRAAYQVEVRNINAAKLRGFFYKPTLHWFDLFHKFMEDTKEIKARESASEAEAEKRYIFIQDKENAMKRKRNEMSQRQTVQIVQARDEESRESSEIEDSSDESEDEFQTFADHIAQQLRSMSVHRAVMIQNQIQRIFARDREMNEEE